MNFNIKFLSAMVFIATIAVSCGGEVPYSRPEVVADKQYILDLREVAESDEQRYHFQVCREGTEGEYCFNPFYEDGKDATFAVLPDAGNLRATGNAKRAVRLVGEGAILLTFATLGIVFVPKAAKIAFKALLSIRKNSDKVLAKMLEARKLEAAGKGRKLTPKEIEKTEKSFKLLKSKPAKFFLALFITEGVIEGWKFSYFLYDTLENLVKKTRWGASELALADAFPYLERGSGKESDERSEVDDITDILQALRSHLGLTFSDAYLLEFDAKSDVPALPAS